MAASLGTQQFIRRSPYLQVSLGHAVPVADVVGAGQGRRIRVDEQRLLVLAVHSGPEHVRVDTGYRALRKREPHRRHRSARQAAEKRAGEHSKAEVPFYRWTKALGEELILVKLHKQKTAFTVSQFTVLGEAGQVAVRAVIAVICDHCEHQRWVHSDVTAAGSR